MIQQLLVVIAVVIAGAYVAWSLTPARVRFTLLSRFDAALARRATTAEGGRVSNALRERVVARLLRRAAPAGGCGSCASNLPPAAVPPRGPRASR